ncbi:PEP/pyruvate-binding domain-containing protein [uncultured Citricoccus sp.]|uniref:PEP/pyruvate-binding domain-containing protein n=1 Tax=uncultured Citricoccus sp. TaxID=614031 RepID=UPI00262182C0|nr:PEP/pyruvate-binding domain-containing protein [uncultured Citricoccus sp.]
MSRYVRPFSELGSGDRESVGGKCTSLGEMVNAGLPVPDGFAVTVDAFEDFRDASELRADLQALVQGMQGAGPQELQRAHDRAVEMILNRPLPAPMEAQITEAYEELVRHAAQRRGLDASQVQIPVAVRSSATDEDGDAASFAGQQETFLWVNGVTAVLEKVRECWASLYTPQAIAYRSSMDAAEGAATSRISVAVQLMATADVAGVTFTVSPKTGDRSVIAINASYGLGQAVVSGEVTPDEYWLSKIGPTIKDSRIADKAHEYVVNAAGTGIELREVDAERRGQACLTQEELIDLARIAMAVEKHYGTPQDIEWALERNADGTSTIMLLQSRPETNWKKRKDEQAARAKAPRATTGMLNLLSAVAKGA